MGTLDGGDNPRMEWQLMDGDTVRVNAAFVQVEMIDLTWNG